TSARCFEDRCLRGARWRCQARLGLPPILGRLDLEANLPRTLLLHGLVAPSPVPVALYRDQYVLLVAVALLHSTRHVPRVVQLVPRRRRAMMVARGVMPVPIIRRVR